jgi:16S rRNA U516 pseudouridylate synthase RsuA-like enzyme
MSKQVAFGAQPAKKPQTITADTWVENRTTENESLKRLTIDIPQGLHRRLKLMAASQGVNMADLVRGWIEAGVEKTQ